MTHLAPESDSDTNPEEVKIKALYYESVNNSNHIPTRRRLSLIHYKKRFASQFPESIIVRKSTPSFSFSRS